MQIDIENTLNNLYYYTKRRQEYNSKKINFFFSIPVFKSFLNKEHLENEKSFKETWRDIDYFLSNVLSHHTTKDNEYFCIGLSKYIKAVANNDNILMNSLENYFSTLEPKLLIKEIGHFKLNTFFMLKHKIINKDKIVQMINNGYHFSNNELNTLFYQQQKNNIFKIIEHLYMEGNIVQPDLIERLQWQKYYTLSSFEQKKYCNYTENSDFLLLEEKITLIKQFEEQLSPKDKSNFYAICTHHVGSLKSRYTYNCYLQQYDKIKEILHEDLPKINESLDTIYSNYLTSLNQQFNIEKKYLYKKS